MSSSRMASIRFQSVLDRLFVFFPLFMICLSQGDDADRIVWAFHECHKGDAALNHPNSNPSLLTIVFTSVGTSQKSASEHFFRFGEMEPVFSDVGAVLAVVPFKNHCNSKCSYISRLADCD